MSNAQYVLTARNVRLSTGVMHQLWSTGARALLELAQFGSFCLYIWTRHIVHVLLYT